MSEVAWSTQVIIALCATLHSRQSKPGIISEIPKGKCITCDIFVFTATKNLLRTKNPISPSKYGVILGGLLNTPRKYRFFDPSNWRLWGRFWGKSLLKRPLKKRETFGLLVFQAVLFTYGLKWWYPQIIHFNRVFHYKPCILGVPLFSETPIYGDFLKYCYCPTTMGFQVFLLKMIILGWFSRYHHSRKHPYVHCTVYTILSKLKQSAHRFCLSAVENFESNLEIWTHFPMTG